VLREHFALVTRTPNRQQQPATRMPKMMPGKISAALSRCPNGTKDKRRGSTFTYLPAK
jgi:hypothetical protein